MNWDDLRHVVTLARSGSLAKAAKQLGVEHTTVGRRIEAAERALSLTLFTRSQQGYKLTTDGERLLASLQEVEDAVLAVERRALARETGHEGNVRVTSPETFGVAWLAPRLAVLGARAPGLSIELLPSGAVVDLVRREADIAIRTFRTKHQSLLVRRLGDFAYGLYASETYLQRRPFTGHRNLASHRLLLPESGVDLAWVKKLAPDAKVSFRSELSLALLEATRAGAGVAVLPRYLGDSSAGLVHLPAPDEPTESLWLTLHKDLRTTPRVRFVLDALVEAARDDGRRLIGRR